MLATLPDHTPHQRSVGALLCLYVSCDRSQCICKQLKPGLIIGSIAALGSGSVNLTLATLPWQVQIVFITTQIQPLNHTRSVLCTCCL